MSDLRLRSVTMKPGFAMADGLANVLTGRGTSVDRGAHNFWHHRTLTPVEIEQGYRTSWLIRKIVDVPAEDMTRAGRDWDADDADIAKIESEEKRLKLWAAIRTALIYARLGGGALFINYADRRPDLPLPPNVRPGGVESIVPLYRTQISLGQPIDDLLDPAYGEPSEFRVNTPARPLVHSSRLIVFKGKTVPAIYNASHEDRFWGDSVVQSVNEAVQNATTATAGFASLIDEAKLDVYRMYQLAEQLLAGNDEAVMQRVTLTNAGKSTHRAIVLDKEDEWDHRQVTWAGIPDVIKTFMAVVAGAADIPATRLLGKSPDGMNATGEGDEAAYFQSIGSKQEMDLRPALDKLDAVVLPSAGVATPDLSWSFSPLKVLSEVQQSEIEKREAETVQIYANAGLIPESALAKSVQNRLIESQRFPGLKQAIKEAEAAGEELPDDDDPSELQAEQRGGGQLSQSAPGVGEGSPPRRRLAANDATPRTLYVRRDVVNVADLKAWARGQGLPELQDGLHVTIAHSRTPLDWMKVDGEWNQDEKGQITIQPGGVRIVEPLGDRTAVLLFTSSALSWRHESILRAGASHNYPDYQPHISLTGEPVDLSSVEPYRGKLVLGPEIFEELNDGGAPTGDRPFGDALKGRAGRRARSQTGNNFNPTQPRDRNGRWIPTGRRSYIDAAAKGSTNAGQIAIGKVGDKAKASLRSAGVRIKGDDVALDASNVRHIVVKHSAERGGQRSVSGADIASASGLLNNARAIRATTPSKNGSERFIALTRSRGERIYTVFEVRKRGVALVTMWKRK
ncbi:anti-CBASS protein Acb1 family protein [Sphingomonas sp.]|uniref:anti-CBASS protein Acb1 family protein n=1 Tax=Sphingomonas sp. TaxID=28214 RepID=UPI003F71F5CC